MCSKYAAPLWQSQVTIHEQLANTDIEDLAAAGVTVLQHAIDVKARSRDIGQLSLVSSSLIMMSPVSY